MKSYYYDLHMHSCLSPCADDDNTPANIAGMATLAGLEIVALTDHNTTANCPAFFEAAKKLGLIPIAGMELTTSEDIHVVCLFEELSDAMSFGSEVARHRILIKNRPDIFGSQLIVDADDNVIGEEEYLLSNATDISIEDVRPLCESFGGIAYPAHIDRDANGIISVLGTIPEDLDFTVYEIHHPENVRAYTERYGLENKTVVVCSDAHYLTDIRDKECFFDIDDEPYSSARVRSQLFKMLRGEK